MNIIIHTPQQLIDWFKSSNYKELSFDTETTSLKYNELDIVGCSFSDGTNHCYVNLFKNPERPKIISVLKYFFTRKAQLVIMHNAAFDLKVLYKIGITHPCENIFCTQTAAHLLKEEDHTGLKYLAEVLLNADTTSYEAASKFGFNSDAFYKYATNDAIWTYKLYQRFQPQIMQQNLSNLFYNIEMPFQFCLRDLEINGILVDLEENKCLGSRVDEMLYNLTLEMCNYAKIPYVSGTDVFGTQLIHPSINFNSVRQMVPVIERLGMEITERTEPSEQYPEGQKSLGASTLKRLANDPFIKLFIQYKKLIKLRDGFIHPLPTFVDEDGRLRSHFNNNIAVTGRLTSSEPNLQQTPRKNDDLHLDFRKVYIAPEGKSLIAADFGGQELRLLGDLSQDRNMIDAFVNNKDLHLMTANFIFNLNIPNEVLCENHPDYKSVKEKYWDKRHTAKNGVNFPIVYGATAKSISLSLGVVQKVAQGYIDGFMKLYPNVRTSMNKCKQFLLRNGYVYNRTGRRRRFTKYDERAFRQAYNFLIQSTAADMTKACMVMFRREASKHPEWEAKIVLTVHDEIVIEVLDQFVEPAKKCLEYCMVNGYKISVPLVVEVSVGKNYSECK